MPEDVRPTYRRFAAEYGPFLNQVKIFAHRPPAVRHLMAMLLELADEALLPKRLLKRWPDLSSMGFALGYRCFGLGPHNVRDERRGTGMRLANRRKNSAVTRPLHLLVRRGNGCRYLPYLQPHSPRASKAAVSLWLMAYVKSR